MKYPHNLSHLTKEQIETLKVKSLTYTNNTLTATVYTNIEHFLNSNSIEDFIGPFADRIGNDPCIRFESKEAAVYLSK